MDLEMISAGGIKTKSNLTKSMKNRMDYLIARQGVVAGNIANASTPGYITQDLSFAGEVVKAGVSLDTTNKSHIEGGKDSSKTLGTITYDNTNIREDGNSVKLDQEMLKLNKIQMSYSLMTKLYAKQAGMQKLALQGSR